MLPRCIVVAAAAFVASSRHEDPYLMMLQQRALMVSEAEGVDIRSHGIGETVPTTEKGYQTVADLKSDDEMKKFIYRVVQNEARFVKDVAELDGLVPFYSGVQSVQSLDALKKELRGAAWIAEGEGRTAPLNEEGYKKVAARKSKPHMMAFARRVLDVHGRKSEDEGSLIGLMPYFDGEISVQSFGKLQMELLSAQWAHQRKEEPDVETTVATTTLATTLATTTLATTLATTTLATTLATTTLATTLATTTLATTLATTTPAPAEEESAEALHASGKAASLVTTDSEKPKKDAESVHAPHNPKSILAKITRGWR